VDVEGALADAELGGLEDLPVDDAHEDERQVEGEEGGEELVGEVVGEMAGVAVLQRAEAEQVRRHAHDGARRPDGDDHRHDPLGGALNAVPAL